MASADSCAFSTAFGGVYSFQSVPHRSPRVPHVSFPPSACLIYARWLRVVIGLRLVWQSHPQRIPYMRFLFVRPEVCPRVSMFPESGFLQIPPRDGHPCLRLYPSHYRADSGLTPVRNVRRRAHEKAQADVPNASLRPVILCRTLQPVNPEDKSSVPVLRDKAGIARPPACSLPAEPGPPQLRFCHRL